MVGISGLSPAVLLGDVFIQELPNHLLILHVVLFGGGFEESHAVGTQGKRYLGLLVLQRQLFR